MADHREVLRVLEQTSRTFYLPIVRLPIDLQKPVAAAYLCLRAIDEIEDHPTLEGQHKARILQAASRVLQEQTSTEGFARQRLAQVFREDRDQLPEVTLRLGEWACHAPDCIAPRIWDATAAMADRMAQWAADGWKIATRADLDRYTYAVAGSVGLLLSDLSAWHDNVQLDRVQTIQFGRGLQAVNIARNRKEDLARGADFFPEGWTNAQMIDYARAHVKSFDLNTQPARRTALRRVIQIPGALALATLDALERGDEKLTRAEVLEIVRQCDAQ